MTIPPAFPTPAPEPQAPAAAAPAAEEGRFGSDFETFLRMLTTQMQNQDPLNPMEATDFAVQLATFSGVEQQVRTNQLLEAFVSQQDLADLSGWVGMDARAAVPGWYDGTPLTIVTPAPGEATKLDLVVRDSTGQEFARHEVPPGDTTVTWPPAQGPDGANPPAGEYRFELVAHGPDGPLPAVPAEIYAPVLEARLEDGGTLLKLKGGHLVPAPEISALRLPD